MYVEGQTTNAVGGRVTTQQLPARKRQLIDNHMTVNLRIARAYTRIPAGLMHLLLPTGNATPLPTHETHVIKEVAPEA